jgi:beta-xylosidase
MLRIFFIFLSLLMFSKNAFASNYTITDISNTKKILKYRGSKVAELRNNNKWKVWCIKGRKRGDVDDRFDTLRTATQFAISVCDKS